MTARELKKRYEALDVRKVLYDVIEQGEQVAEETNKMQLFAGQDANGEYLSPTYQQDPYFKTKEQAQKYSDWKDSREERHPYRSYAFPLRPSGVPNLIIDGTMVYNNIRVLKMGDDLKLTNAQSVVSEIEGKYGKVFGLNPTGAKYFNEVYARKEFIKNVRQALGL